MVTVIMEQLVMMANANVYSTVLNMVLILKNIEFVELIPKREKKHFIIFGKFLKYRNYESWTMTHGL